MKQNNELVQTYFFHFIIIDDFAMVINYFEVLLNKKSNKVSIINYYPLWISLQKQNSKLSYSR